MFDFFYGNCNEQYLFYRIPQLLFTDDRFKKMSCEAKVLYGLLLDRTGLSRKNNWYDKSGRLFVYYCQTEACEKLNIGREKAVKIFSELEKVGLIIRKKQGQGNPTKIYVMNFATKTETDTLKSSEKKLQENFQTSENQKSESKTEVKTSENQKSRPPKIRSQDFRKSDTNHTDMNHTDMNHTDISSINQSNSNSSQKQKSKDDGLIDKIDSKETYSIIEDDVKSQIEYSTLLANGTDRGNLDLIVSIIADIYFNNRSIAVNGQTVPAFKVVKELSKIDENHIEYVLDCLRETSKTKRIRNIRNYLQACLYNAPSTMDTYYTSLTAYDLANQS